MTLSAIYFIFVFVSACSVLQIVSSYNRSVGFAFFLNKPFLGYIISAIVIITIYWWFFYRTGNKNTREGILEGAQQLGWSAFAIAGAVIFTMLVCSLLRMRGPHRHEGERKKGLGALQQETLFQIIHYRRPRKR